MEVRDDGVHNACSTPGYFLKPVFLSGTVPCNATYLPTYLPVNSKDRNRDIAPSCCSELYVAQQTPFFFLFYFISQPYLFISLFELKGADHQIGFASNIVPSVSDPGPISKFIKAARFILQKAI
jgi:hypothetical protein